MSSEDELEIIRRKKMLELMKRGVVDRRKTVMPSGVVRLTEANFDEYLGKYPLVIVDFWAEWCMPCKVYAPLFEELAKRYSGRAVFAKVNVDENPSIARRYSIMSIPTTIIFYKGREYERLIGLSPMNMMRLRNIIENLS